MSGGPPAAQALMHARGPPCPAARGRTQPAGGGEGQGRARQSAALVAGYLYYAAARLRSIHPAAAAAVTSLSGSVYSKLATKGRAAVFSSVLLSWRSRAGRSAGQDCCSLCFDLT